MSLIIGTVTQHTSTFRSVISYTVSQSVSGNYSDVTAEVLVDTSSSSQDWNGTVSGMNLSINGDNQTYASFNSNSDDGWTYTAAESPTGRTAQTFKTRTVRVTHNEDGTKTINLNTAFSLPSGGYGPGDVSVDDDVVLPAIDRGIIHTNVSGTWKQGIMYVNVSGTWKQAIGVYSNVSGTWKQSI